MKRDKPVLSIERTPTPAYTAPSPMTFNRRRGREPLWYSAQRADFTCICQRPHTASDEVVECDCGRRWVKR